MSLATVASSDRQFSSWEQALSAARNKFAAHIRSTEADGSG
jgi:hypothetical protein